MRLRLVCPAGELVAKLLDCSARSKSGDKVTVESD